MSSGTDSASAIFDPILKLWISLWSIVLENKRHYSSVYAVLQRLVFEKTEWPKFKNWPVICQLGTTEPLMQKILEELDLSKTSERNARIIAAFGDCFSLTKVTGIPLSVIQRYITKQRQQVHEEPEEEALEGAKRGLYLLGRGEDHISAFGFPLTFLFNCEHDDLAESEVDGHDDALRFVFPDNIKFENVEPWSLITFDGKAYAVVDMDDSEVERIAITPAEYIDLEL